MENAFPPKKLVRVKVGILLHRKKVIFCASDIAVNVLVYLNTVAVISFDADIFVATTIVGITLASIPRCAAMSLQVGKFLSLVAADYK